MCRGSVLVCEVTGMDPLPSSAFAHGGVWTDTAASRGVNVALADARGL